MKAISHTLLILVYITTISPSSARTATTTSSTTTFDAATSFIIFICRSTTYPKLCEKTCLPSAAKIEVDIKKMAHHALNATLAIAKSTSLTVYQLSKERKLEQSEKAATQDCIKLTNNSVARIKQSLDELDKMKNVSNDTDRRFKLSNVKTRISAAMTDYQTCMEGLNEVNASVYVKRKIKNSVQYGMMLLSNALAIVNKIK